jgi:peptidoglycan/LPS O-acetylase OafA/YrhL
MTSRLQLLDALRATAALLVLTFHFEGLLDFGPPVGGPEANNQRFYFGLMGVEFFFVISGLVILLTIERRKKLSRYGSCCSCCRKGRATRQLALLSLAARLARIRRLRIFSPWSARYRRCNTSSTAIALVSLVINSLCERILRCKLRKIIRLITTHV